jgi:hypothetical protein
MRCMECRRRINRRVYYYDNNRYCIDCFEDICTEETLNHYSNMFTSVTEIIYIS